MYQKACIKTIFTFYDDAMDAGVFFVVIKTLFHCFQFIKRKKLRNLVSSFEFRTKDQIVLVAMNHRGINTFSRFNLGLQIINFFTNWSMRYFSPGWVLTRQQVADVEIWLSSFFEDLWSYQFKNCFFIVLFSDFLRVCHDNSWITQGSVRAE